MRNIFILFAATLFAAATAQAGDIYRWKDSNGLWHYADQPVPGAERVAANARGINPKGDAATATSAASNARIGVTNGAGDSADTTQKVRDDVAAMKASKCKDAQASYEQTINARRLFRPGPNGEPQYLNDEESEAARVAARSTMDYYCGK